MSTRRTKTAVLSVLIATAVASAVSWGYRFVDDYLPFDAIAFYVLVPLVTWMLFAGPLWLLLSDRRWLRIMGIVLLLPTTALLAISVLVGFYGLKIH